LIVHMYIQSQSKKIMGIFALGLDGESRASKASDWSLTHVALGKEGVSAW